ncbi:hypothetical protein KSP39_PZI002404 [Platanthera zijinensis]|uniref:TIP41-like protein n=1 Tax=Platanthera zijinensis TaxID=2320716 RepID=A0AAP0BXW8_9ASPA
MKILRHRASALPSPCLCPASIVFSRGSAAVEGDARIPADVVEGDARAEVADAVEGDAGTARSLLQLLLLRRRSSLSPLSSPTEKDLNDAAAGALPDGRRGIRIKGWEIESCKRPILGSLATREWEEKLGTSHLPEMIFGESSLNLLHMESGIRIHFNAFDALKGWKQEPLPPVEVIAAAKWKFRSKPIQQIILDYDYTFTTPYCGSEAIEVKHEKFNATIKLLHSDNGHEYVDSSLNWEDCHQRINLAALSSNEPILFYDEIILYEDELADNGISLLTVKVRVMPSSWFLLLRFWLTALLPQAPTLRPSASNSSYFMACSALHPLLLPPPPLQLRVDGVLMRLRDTRIYCSFSGDNGSQPALLRESCWREATIQSFIAKAYKTMDSSGEPEVGCRSGSEQ